MKTSQVSPIKSLFYERKRRYKTNLAKPFTSFCDCHLNADLFLYLEPKVLKSDH